MGVTVYGKLLESSNWLKFIGYEIFWFQVQYAFLPIDSTRD